MNDNLPQVCSKCRKLKAANLGSFVKVRSQWSKRLWICDNCHTKPAFTRGRQRKPSPAERMAITILIRTGFPFQQEFPLGKFWFDFAIPALRLLIEVDSWTYHHTPWQLRRDAAKRKVGETEGWKVVNFNWKQDLDGHITSEVDRRKSELGL